VGCYLEGSAHRPEQVSGGKIFVIGTGPGGMEHMTLKALQALAECQVVIGYLRYTELVQKMLEGKEVLSSGMHRERERCRRAVEEASRGRKVALISGGDAGIYGLAGVVFQVLEEENTAPEVEVIPGVTAASAAASLLGAPLMHDFAAISLSDLLTPWTLIEERLHAAGKGDFVIVLYNPRSRGRRAQLQKARDIILQYRSGRTPVGIVRNAARPGEKKILTFLEHLPEEEIDMSSTVIVGNSSSYVWQDKLITPRGYKR